MADISSIMLPSGNTYDIKDSTARSAIPTKVSDLVDDVQLYSASNPPPYPVTSVNGSTGAVTGLQTTSNLVTSISSSSTDSKYPSAKCVYDLVGDIETLLSSI